MKVHENRKKYVILQHYLIYYIKYGTTGYEQ